MAGHSQFKNIMHRKGRQDKQRSKLYSKLAREITTAASLGLPEPEHNPRLRTAVLAARKENMPRDNIDRAIKKSQDAGGVGYEEIRYEGRGTGGIGVIVEALTDNRNRTASEVRSTFTKFGGQLGETGSVSFMFDKKGEIEFGVEAAKGDQMFEAALDAGCDDVQSDDDGHWLYCDPDGFAAILTALTAKFGDPKSAKIMWKPQSTVGVEDDKGEKLLKMIEILEESEDVQNVYANFELSESLMAKLSA